MPTSGSFDYSVTAEEIIKEALEIVRAINQGQTPSTDMYASSLRTFNLMVKTWMSRGINIWAIDKITLFLEEDKKDYVTGTDHIALTSGVTRTELASAAASGASTISVDSATGIATTYAIGVELDDGTVQWTTVNGAPVGTTITLTTALTGAASADNAVYVYVSKVNALRIKSVLEVVRRTKQLQDTPLSIISRQEYHHLGDKSTEGSVNQIQVQPNLSSTTITVYPVSDDETDTLELICKRPVEDFDATSNTPDFPQEWYEPLVLGLASRVGLKYELSAREKQMLEERAEAALLQVEGWDREQETSVSFSPMGRWND